MKSSESNALSWLRKVWSSNDAPWRLLALSALVGVAAGLGAIIFYVMLDAARWLLLEHVAGYNEGGPGGEAPLFPHVAREFSRWTLFILPAAGGLLSGWIVYRFAPEAAGHGTDAAIHNYHFGKGKPNARLPLVKALSAAITIGSGGSGGREGPIAQIGSSFGGLLASWLRLTRRERRILMAAGMGGGVGAIFHAPMAGAIFAAEVLYRELDLEYEVIIPSIVSSVVAYAVFTAVFGWDPLFVTPNFVFENALELLPYLGLAAIVALGATFYTRTFYAVHHGFERLKLHPALKPAIGGLLTGCIGLAIPAALGTGYGTIQRALTNGTSLASEFGTIGAGVLLAIAFSKTLTTAFSIGSGGSGGVFGPAIVVGGALGGAFGLLVDRLFPGLHIQPGAFVLVGMTGFFAAAANAPLSTIIMVSEMTGNYHLLVPSLWVCTIAYLLCRRTNLYVEQLHNRFEAPAHLENMMAAVLRRLTIADLLHGQHSSTITAVKPETPFTELLNRYSQMTCSSFAITDGQGHLRGIIRARDIRNALNMSPDQHAALIAADLAIRPVSVTDRDSLLTAVTRMRKYELDEIVAIASDGTASVLATISHQDITDSYYAQTRTAAMPPLAAKRPAQTTSPHRDAQPPVTPGPFRQLFGRLRNIAEKKDPRI